MAFFLMPVASSCNNVASTDQIGPSRRQRYPSKQEEGRDTMQGTALCCFVDLSERCRPNCDMEKKEKQSCVKFMIVFFLCLRVVQHSWLSVIVRVD